MRREGGSGQWLVSATRWERRGDGAEHMVDEVPGGDRGGTRHTVDMDDGGYECGAGVGGDGWGTAGAGMRSMWEQGACREKVVAGVGKLRGQGGVWGGGAARDGNLGSLIRCGSRYPLHTSHLSCIPFLTIHLDLICKHYHRGDSGDNLSAGDFGKDCEQDYSSRSGWHCGVARQWFSSHG